MGTPSLGACTVKAGYAGFDMTLSISSDGTAPGVVRHMVLGGGEGRGGILALEPAERGLYPGSSCHCGGRNKGGFSMLFGPTSPAHLSCSPRLLRTLGRKARCQQSCGAGLEGDAREMQRRVRHRAGNMMVMDTTEWRRETWEYCTVGNPRLHAHMDGGWMKSRWSAYDCS